MNYVRELVLSRFIIANSYLISDEFAFNPHKAEFTRNNHGNPQLVDNEGFVYNLHKSDKFTGPLVYWRCTKKSVREGWKCSARATTEGEYIVKRVNLHKHPVEYGNR